MNNKELQFVEKKLGIETQILKAWEEKLSLKTFNIGEIILNSNSISKSILILLDGKIRLRGVSDSQNKKISSIGVLEAPEIIGIASNLLKKPIEIVSAGSECTFLSIPAKDWKSFNKNIQNNDEGLEKTK